MTILPDIIARLTTGSTTFKPGGSTGARIPIWANQFPPDTADTAAAIYESGGTFPLDAFSTGPVVRRPSVQIITRAPTYPQARDIADLLWNSLYGDAWASTSATYLSVMPNQDPIDMGVDSEDRHMISCNFTLQVRP